MHGVYLLLGETGNRFYVDSQYVAGSARFVAEAPATLAEGVRR